MNKASALPAFSGLVFLSLGLIKILSGYRENSMLSETAHYFLSFSEIFLGISFWTKYRRFSYPLGIIFFAGSLLLPFVFQPQGCGCGCFGRAFFLDKRTHLILSSLLGLFFSLAWILSEPSSRTGKRKILFPRKRAI